MKRLYYIINLILISSLCCQSCKDDFNHVLYPDGPLELSVSTSDIVLNVAAPEQEAVVFDWTSGSNFGTNAAIKYTLEIGEKGKDFKPVISSTFEKGLRSQRYVTKDFNQLLIEKLGITAGSGAQLEARVTAEVQDGQSAAQLSQIISLKVKTYKPVTETLYILGSATSNGWDANKASKMNPIQGTPGAFIWQGVLSPGEFKFISTLGNFTPSYNKGTSNEKLYYRESESDPYDVPFTVAKSGLYQVKVNLIDLSIAIAEIEGAMYDALWFVGGFTGWNFQPMAKDPNDPFIFTYHAVLNSGNSTDEFKIATKPDFDLGVVFLRPETDQQGVGTDLPVVKWSESENKNDYKWRINKGTYKIRLDLRTNKITIAPFTPFAAIYLVGDATPNGWDIAAATPMVNGDTPHRFTWSGTLKAGELKFSCDKQADWNGAWFLASQNGRIPSGQTEQMIFSKSGSNPDNKWKVTTPGTYSITLDQLLETVTIIKQ